ncbi:MAG: hypothetical protein KJ955_03505 [Nanoarchaeota archaeon]|nr:hypothetical protein [Nanoarchaeota archaeon]
MIVEILSYIVAIVFGMIAVIKIAGQAEIVLGALTLSFGITAVIWVIKARKSLSRGSSLRSLTTHFLFTLLFMLAFTVWNLISKIMMINAGSNVPSAPPYLFISLVYITFVGIAYKIKKLGEEFGFSSQSKEIEKLMKKKKKKA